MRFLREAIESVLNQTFSDFELIIIDDGSTDGSDKIIREFAARDGRIRVVTQQNKGLVASLNLALSLARGEFFARMDADDVCMNNRFQVQLEYLLAHPDVGVVGGNIAAIDEAGNFLQSVVYPQGDDAREALLRGSPVAHPAVLARTAVLRLVGGYRAYYRHCEDYDLWLRVSECARLDNVDTCVLSYRHHRSSVSVINSMDQRIGTCIAQAVHVYKQRAGIDVTADLPALGWEAFLLVPLVTEEQATVWLRLIPMLVIGRAFSDIEDEVLEGFRSARRYAKGCDRELLYCCYAAWGKMIWSHSRPLAVYYAVKACVCSPWSVARGVKRELFSRFLGAKKRKKC